MCEIWLTGDIHGRPDRLSSGVFPEGRQLTRQDVVGILGDFGLVWEHTGESGEERWLLDWLEKKPWTTVATLGNHENYARIQELPIAEQFGAPVWVVRPHVYLLQSGYVYNIGGHKIWNFNGARSHDISDGIIDGSDPGWKKKAKEMFDAGKRQFRVKGISWWPEELEQDERVYERGLANLAAVDYDVDFVWTHCAPSETQKQLGFYETDRLTDYLQRVDDAFAEHGKAPRWYFGHYHDNKQPEYHKYLLYEQIIRIA